MKHQKSLTEESASRLVALFLDGATSPAEEESLYAFFRASRAGSLSPALEAYRPMFAWYDGLGRNEERKPAVSFWNRFKYAGVACVSAVLVAGICFVAKEASASENPLYAQYDGSYVIRNGKRVSDMDKILGTVMRAERLADSLESVAEREERLLDCDYDRILVETALSNVADPALAMELRSELLSDSYENL